MSSRNGWVRVTRDNPCPICGKDHNCSVSTDGNAVLCGRVENAPGEYRNQGGQFLHRIDDPRRISVPRSRPERKPAPVRNFAKLTRDYHEAGRQHLKTLEEQLGPSVAAWDRLQTGKHGVLWTHPEFDANQNPIGITTRAPDGTKRQLSGGRRGLIIPRDFLREPGTILCPEGASGTAALLTLGFPVIGRFNNSGGADFLAELLKTCIEEARERGLVLIADNDRKPDGSCPGWQGAESVARTIADYLRLSVGVSFPPDGVKDSRDWYLRFRGTASIDTLRQQYAELLRVTYFHPPVLAERRPEPSPRITLEDGREQMFAARADTLGRHGVYLDRMECGAGKTYSDLKASQRAIARQIRCLFIVPTHQNCQEVEEDALALGIDAEAYPKRVTAPDPMLGETQNCWNDQADECESMGLPVVSAVCATCAEHSKCLEQGYMGGLIRAREADLAIATHSRGQVQGPDELAACRGYVAIHEDSRQLLRPMDEITPESVQSAWAFLEVMSNDPTILNSSWFNAAAPPSEADEEVDDG